MPNPTRIWQLISLVLAVALIATLLKLHHTTTANRPVTGTLPTANNGLGFERLVLSPNALRAYERYSL